MDQRTRKSPARFLAPLALIVVIVAFLAIVTSGGGGGTNTSTGTGSQSSSGTSSTKTSSSSTRTAKKKAASRRRFYIIKAGDTLGSIAARTGIPLATIQALNPNVDPSAMTTGQKIRLR